MTDPKISHYRLLEAVEWGAWSVVYRAEDTRGGRAVTVEVLDEDVYGGSQDRADLATGLQRAGDLIHPNICPPIDTGEENGQVFIVVDRTGFTTLEDKMGGGPLAPDEAIHLTSEVARGLAVAHGQGIVHGRITTRRILIGAHGRVRLGGFGLGARLLSRARAEGIDVGDALFYMSPEQLVGEASLDARTDIWSTGVCLYEMLTGRLPFAGDYESATIYAILNEEPPPLGEIRGAPREIDRVIKKALAKQPADRYQTVDELLSDLRSVRLAADRIEPALIAKEEPSVAVLPFANMSPDPDQEFFCDGIADEIINSLARVGGLRVVSRTSSFAFKNRMEDIRDIGHKLDVDTLLEGSVRKAGNRLRITTQLVKVENGFHMWSGQFDREVDDVFDIQEQIAHNVVDALKVQLTEGERVAMTRTDTKNVDAYGYYLRGRQYFYRFKREAITRACEMYHEAIKQDSRYALACAGLADCYSYLHMYFGGEQENAQKADEWSRRAIELAPKLAEAHASRGLAASLSGRYDEAESSFQRAVNLNPRLFEAYYFWARICFVEGKYAQSAELFEQASTVNPEDYQAASLRGFAFRVMGDLEAAREAEARALELVERHLKFHADDARAVYLGAMSHLTLGNLEVAKQWARRAYAIAPDDSYNVYGQACFYSLIGETQDAIRYFEEALDAGFAHLEWVENDSDLDALRDDPRFQALIDRLRGHPA